MTKKLLDFHRLDELKNFIGIPLFVTACFDNSGFSGVNHPVGFLPCRFSPFVNKSLCQFNFHSIFSLIGDLFVLPRTLHVNLIN